MKHYLLFFLLAFLFSTVGYGQSYRGVKSEGDGFFKDGFYELAVNRYEECHKLKPTDFGVSFNLGVSYLLLNRMKEAEEMLLPVYDNKKQKFSDVVYYLGFLNHRWSRYRRAAKYYKEYLSENRHGYYTNFVKVKLRNCERGILSKKQNKIAAVKGFDESINSTRDDFHPIYSPNAQLERIYFSSNRLGVLGGLRDDAGKVDSDRGHRNPDMFVLTRSPVFEVKNFSGMLNTSLFDEVMGFSFDGQKMFYKKGYTKHSGLLYEDDFTRGNKERISSKLVDIPFDMQQGDRTPFFFMDSVVYFSSRLLEGYGGYDIFASTHTPDGWSEPVNLGPGINSQYDEECAFLTNNKKSLYFSSNRPSGIGGYDVFKSEFATGLNRWNKAQNMGTPINSPDDDLYFQLADDGWNFVLSSNRYEAIGQQDIFEGHFFEQQLDQVVMLTSVEQEAIEDTTTIISATILFQKYPVGAVIPTPKQFEDLTALAEICNANPEAKLVLNIHLTSNKTKSYKSKLDPLSDVVIAYMNGKTDMPINVTRKLLAPKETVEPGTFVEVILQYPAGKNIQPINEVEQYAFVPRLAKGLRYKIEVADSPAFDDFLLNSKYDFSFNLWPEEDEQIHILYREFFTFDTAEQWAEQLEGIDIEVIRIMPFLNGTAIAKIDNNLIAEYPELKEFFMQRKANADSSK